MTSNIITITISQISPSSACPLSVIEVFGERERGPGGRERGERGGRLSEYEHHRNEGRKQTYCLPLECCAKYCPVSSSQQSLSVGIISLAL